ncbi:MAG: D-2-hydroxyacid dehydrogenase [Vicinamibacterales bacterium]
MTVLVAIYSPFDSWCIPEAQVERLRREFPEHRFVRADSDEETLARIPDADVAFSSLINREHFEAARRLRWIHSPAAGVGGMLFPEMVASAIVITNSRGNSSATIAEHTIGAVIALLRQFPLAWRRQSECVWAQDELNAPGAIRLLRDCRVLIVGMGSIGGETARLAAAFGADVVGIRRRATTDRPAGVRQVVTADRLHDELADADVVVIAAPQTRETVHLLGAAELAMMKSAAVLVNVSRGKLIDEAALASALASGRLRAAALDVFEHEPLSAESPLWVRSDVMITPHVSGFQASHWPNAAALFAANLRRFCAGEPLVNLVDKQAGY